MQVPRSSFHYLEYRIHLISVTHIQPTFEASRTTQQPLFLKQAACIFFIAGSSAHLIIPNRSCLYSPHVVCFAALPIYNTSALEESVEEKVEHRPHGGGYVKAREAIA